MPPRRSRADTRRSKRPSVGVSAPSRRCSRTLRGTRAAPASARAGATAAVRSGLVSDARRGGRLRPGVPRPPGADRRGRLGPLDALSRPRDRRRGPGDGARVHRPGAAGAAARACRALGRRRRAARAGDMLLEPALRRHPVRGFQPHPDAGHRRRLAAQSHPAGLAGACWCISTTCSCLIPTPTSWAWRGYNEQQAIAALLGRAYDCLFLSHYVATNERATRARRAGRIAAPRSRVREQPLVGQAQLRRRRVLKDGRDQGDRGGNMGGGGGGGGGRGGRGGSWYNEGQRGGGKVMVGSAKLAALALRLLVRGRCHERGACSPDPRSLGAQARRRPTTWRTCRPRPDRSEQGFAAPRPRRQHGAHAGAVGIVTDGMVRDAAEILGLGIPMFCRGGDAELGISERPRRGRLPLAMRGRRRGRGRGAQAQVGEVTARLERVAAKEAEMRQGGRRRDPLASGSLP